jgi:hypothetical protein
MTADTGLFAGPVLNKYLSALLHIGIVIAGALAAVIDQPITVTVALQLAVLAAGSVVTYLVPLLDKQWQGILKTLIGGVLPAVVTAALPFLPGLAGHLSAQTLIPVIAAVLAAVGVEIGAGARTDTAPTPVDPLPAPAPLPAASAVVPSDPAPSVIVPSDAVPATSSPTAS